MADTEMHTGEITRLAAALAKAEATITREREENGRTLVALLAERDEARTDFADAQHMIKLSVAEHNTLTAERDTLRRALEEQAAEVNAARAMFDSMKSIKVNLYLASGKQITLGESIAARAYIEARNASAALTSPKVTETTDRGETGGETSGGVRAIADERARQTTKEDWDNAHDDSHHDGALAMAAACYALPEAHRGKKSRGMWPSTRSAAVELFVPKFWPWDYEWWKPTPNDRRRELVKAGALIAAEIDRLDRAALSPTSKGGEA